MIVNICELPVQLTPPLVYTAVTVIVATNGAVPALTAINEAILPVPFAANPIDGALLVQLKESAPVGPVVGLLKLITAVGVPLHTTWPATGFTIGVGFIVIVNVTGVPTQPLATGVTVMVAVIGPLVALVVKNGSISPLPLAARPMPVLLFVQLKTVPATVPPTVPSKAISNVVAPVQYTLLLTGKTVGVGFTVIVKFFEGPVQLAPPLVYTGVTTIVAVTGTFVAFNAVNDPILPVPPAARPIDGLLFVQLKTVPATAPLKLTAAVAVLLHTTWLATGSMIGGGLTVIVNVIGVPTQLTAPLVYVGVTVIVATTGALVTLIATKLAILPVPLAARPMLGALLVQS